MIKTNLSSSEIQDLINRYTSELKKLEFQVEDVKLTISGLENLIKEVNQRENTSFAKLKSGKSNLSEMSSSGKMRKNKTAIVESLISEAERPRRAKSKKEAENQVSGYKLSDWDMYVIESIQQAGKVSITQEIIDFVKDRMIASGKSTSDSEVKNKVTRSLQKLVNRRGDLAKVTYKGKGFAYALPEWVGQKGKLQPEFKRS